MASIWIRFLWVCAFVVLSIVDIPAAETSDQGLEQLAAADGWGQRMKEQLERAQQLEGQGNSSGAGQARAMAEFARARGEAAINEYILSESVGMGLLTDKQYKELPESPRVRREVRDLIEGGAEMGVEPEEVSEQVGNFLESSD